MKLYRLNQAEVVELAEHNVIALLPIGATEVHGNHLPVGTDILLAEAMCDKIEEALGTERVVILPTINYGQVWSLGLVPGSVDIPDSILSAYLVQIAKAVAQIGIRKLAVINSHVGNETAIKKASRSVYDDGIDVQIYSLTYPGMNQAVSEVCTARLPHHGFFHACEIETSLMLYLAPEYVDMSKAICQYPEFPVDYDYTSRRWSEFMDTAVLGDATQATASKGKEIVDVVIKNIMQILQGAE